MRVTTSGRSLAPPLLVEIAKAIEAMTEGGLLISGRGPGAAGK